MRAPIGLRISSKRRAGGISQAELARFLGVSRQVVNQHLSDWRRLGWIELGRTQIVIRNTEALRTMIAEGTKV